MARAAKKDQTVVTKSEVTKVEEQVSKLPAYLQDKARTVALGNTDKTDLIMPRIKLLQAVSPEVTLHNHAKAGHFWHSLAEEDLGETLDFIVITIRKSLVLWAPRDDQRGVLARSNDCIKWDRPDEEFEVKIKNVKDKQKYRLGASVAESTGGDGIRLDAFGSSIQGEPNSQPAAALTYNTLAYFPTLDALAILLNTRSSVKPAKLLISKIEMANIDQYALKFTATPRKEGEGSDSYFNYAYTRSGFADERQYGACADYYKRFAGEDFRANDEEEEQAARGATPGEVPKTASGAERF